jgi:hypothetical protein
MFTKWFQAVDVAVVMSIYLAFVNRLRVVAPNRFPIFELITAVIAVDCTLRNRRRFRCHSSLPSTMANDSRRVDAAKRLSSNRLYPMPVVQRWVNGVGCVG